MTKGRTKKKKQIETYEHSDKDRANNPPVGLVTPDTDKETGRKKYEYDPHLDPQLQWAGKAEHTSFEVPTVSLHVHERIDSKRIIEQVRKTNGSDSQLSLFEQDKKPLREAIEFYKHRENWSNRLIAGDSLLVMNSLLEKEGMGDKVQMVYFDPPYGIKYGSNFQPFVNKRDVKDGKDDDLTAEPEMIKAFRDTWELGIHSYLTYLRDRLLLARELLDESGSVFVQIGDENIHLVRNLLDDIFLPHNFVAQITFAKTSAFSTNLISRNHDYLLWFAKDINHVKYRQLYLPRVERTEGGTFNWVELDDGSYRKLTKDEKENRETIRGRAFRASDITSSGETKEGSKPFVFQGEEFTPAKGNHWKTSHDGLKNLVDENRIIKNGKNLAYKRFEDDFPYMVLTDVWEDTIIGTFSKKLYVVQTGPLAVLRCILMTTDPGDLVLDPTCGSGTTAFVAEEFGRRWITCDTSRVAVTLAKQRLMTSIFNYYELAHPHEGVGSGIKYEEVPHITLKSIATGQPPKPEFLYDQPQVDTKKTRVTGPFTVEAVPAPVVKTFEETETNGQGEETDLSVARSGETLRQQEWGDRLRLGGARGKGGEILEFNRVETLAGTKYLQAEAETKESNPKRVVICYGPEHAPLEQRTVELALEEAQTLRPKPSIILFCAFQFDPEARKDIEETNWPGVILLEAQMDQDLQTEDLKKKPRDKQHPAFWLIGQPDVQIKDAGDGKKQVEVRGFDYYNPKNGNVDSGGKGNIAMWMLDTDYDGRSLFPAQVFFPMAGAKDGWAKLAKNLKVNIDEEKIEAFRGTESLPFEPGKQIAVKIIDDRGIESFKIIRP